MRVSVVVCTLNRADALVATLECLRHQNHDDFEVIVVNGPSTDRTLELLEPWRDRIHYFDNPLRNLSVSRNIGVRAASGDLVAFIDDDALAEAEWLNQAIPAFDDPEVAGAGGLVFDHTGMGLQYRYTSTNRLLRSTPGQREFVGQCFPGSFQFPFLQGTNQIYRRDRLMAVGGFDENIFFYGDDCDIGGRLIDAGWIIRQLPTSPVHHKYLPSGIRDHQRITIDWTPVVHDHTYFCMRHAWPFLTEDDILQSIHEFMDSRVADTLMHEQAGRLPAGSAGRARATCMRAFADAFEVGRSNMRKALPKLEHDGTPFLRFETIRAERRQRIVFVSNSYTGNLAGGIARFISDLAPAMAARGHDVRVVAKATGLASVEFEDGVWVHRVHAPLLGDGAGVDPALPPPINVFATAALNEIERMREWTEPDVIYTPMWDVEGIGILRETDLPVAIQVATPIAVAGEMAGFLVADDVAPDMRRLLDAEAEVMETADLFHANSAAVLETIRTRNGVECGPDRWQVVSLGLVDHTTEPPVASMRAAGTGRRVYFAGRFETRKGIDTLLEAMARVLPDHPDVELVLAGEDRPLLPGEEAIGQRWTREHAAEPWIERVTMLGVVDDETLHDEYAKADLVVLPSRDESFGLVMVEAMMHARALVSTDTSGVREVVRNGVDGILVPPGDVDELESAIRRLLDDREHALTLAKSGRERFVDFLSIEHFAARFEDFAARLGRRGPVGSDDTSVTVASGGSVEFDVSGATAATAIVSSDGDVSFRLLDGTTRAFDLRGPVRRRIRVDTAGGTVVVAVDAGTLDVERLVAVDGEAVAG